MHTKLSKKGFTLVELLVAMVIILFLGIGLAKGVLELIKLDMRIKVRQTAQQVVESWASYIQALPYNSWVISPGEEYKDYCHSIKLKWGEYPNRFVCCINPNDPNRPPNCTSYEDPENPDCALCRFMAPDVQANDSDGDGILYIYDPYEGDNNCREGQANCTDEYMKYRWPSWNLAEHLRLAPDQGSDNCACRLGNCQENIPLKCTYQVGKSGGVSWQSAPGNKVYVGITVVNYAHLQNPTDIVGKAIGIVAWYFDPTDKKYRAYTKVVFKEKP